MFLVQQLRGAGADPRSLPKSGRLRSRLSGRTPLRGEPSVEVASLANCNAAGGEGGAGEHVHPTLHGRCALERERQDGGNVRAPARARAPRPCMRGLQMRPRLHRPALSSPRRGCALGQFRRLLHRRPDAARPGLARGAAGAGCRGARGGYGLLRRHGARRGRREAATRLRATRKRRSF